MRAVHCRETSGGFRSTRVIGWLLALLISVCSFMAQAQTPAADQPTPDPSAKPDSQATEISPPAVSTALLPKNLFLDQKNFWTAPAHMTAKQWEWSVPAVITGLALMATDTKFEKHVPMSPSTVSHSVTASNAGLVALSATGAGLFLLGHLKGDDQQRETGLLSGEAALDAYLDTLAFKYAAARERPFAGTSPGRFFVGGDSFPAQHAAVSWAIASVVAHEYPGFLTQALAYGMAAGVSAARVTGHKHFVSDVAVGSALGWYTGRQVFRSHSRYSDAEIARYGTFNREESDEAQALHKAQKIGSSYVPLDSWVYPAIDRLAARDYLKSAFFTSRPWTRVEAANLVNEAKGLVDADKNAPEDVVAIEHELEREFGYERGVLEGNSNLSARVESLYTRNVLISGPPLHDSYHFGQTIFDDYGRPFERGFNTYNGFSSYGTVGPFAIYVRGEGQHAPSAPAYSQTARNAIAAADQNSVQSATPFATVNQFRLLDTYVSAEAAGWGLSFGKQSLWWGPTDGGALMVSDNAEPIYMFRANQTFVDLPGVLSHLGKVKIDLFFGKLSGNQFPARPLIHGERISFKTTQYWEFGFQHTSELGGVGRPLTAAAIWESYVAIHSSFTYPANQNPGKRTLGLDFSYRVPYLRDWLTIYASGLLPSANAFNVDNSPSVLKDPSRTAMRSGFYMPRLPHVPKLDLHVESVYTDPPTARSIRGDYVYWDGFYKDLYTNKKNLIGDWVGREGMGFQAWSNYWFTPKSSLQASYRHAKVDKDFIPGGETLNDGSMKILWWFGSRMSVGASVQYEKWSAPILASTAQTNWTSTVEIALWPKFWNR
jgi:membrane-associated phospholipid phosphatase